MIKIKNVNLRKILNSAGKETIEVEMSINDLIKERASAPSAIIPGKRELFTSSKINDDSLKEMIREIGNKNFQSQIEFDNILSKYIKHIGTNISLPFSLCFARLMAIAKNITLTQYIADIANCTHNKKSPIPLVTIFSGGVHNLKENGSIQNIMIAVDIHPFSEAIQPILEIYSYIEKKIKEKGLLSGYGNSSGMIVEKMDVDEKFLMVINAIKKLGYEKDVSIAIDVAAEHLFKDNMYTYLGKELNSNEFSKIIDKYIRNYNITYVEDPYDSEDEEHWKKMRLEHKKISVFGDDIFATQAKYINNELANGIIIKMNQVGTLTDTIRTFNKAREEHMSTCVSHRSIETEDSFMCDLAVALNSTYIKIGGPRRGDRIIKYNQLLRLEGNSCI